MADVNLDEIDAELQRRGIDPNSLATSSSVYNTPNPTYGQMSQAQVPGTPGMNVPQSFGQGLADVFVRDPLIGLGKAGQGLESAPYNIANAISPNAGAAVGKYLPPQNIDFASMLGQQNAGPLDKLVQGAAQFGPYALAGGPSILGQAGAGAGYGLTQSKTPFQSAAVEGIAGALPGIGGAALNYASNAIAPSIIKEQLAPKILAGLNDVYSKKVGLLNDASQGLTENTAHDKAVQMAQGLGDQGKLDPSGFHAQIDAQMQALQDEKTRAPFRASEIDQALTKLQGVRDSKLDTLADGFQLAKDLNQEYGSKSLIDKPLPFQMMTNARGMLEGTLDDATRMATPDVAAANQMRNIANALTEQRVRQRTFEGTHSDIDLGAVPFTNKYARLSQTDRDNLFSPVQQQQIDALRQAALRQKFAGAPSIVNKVADPTGKVLAHIPLDLGFARYQMANPQSTGQIPSLANYGLIPGLNNFMNPPGAQ